MASLTGLCSVNFLKQLRPTCLGMELLTVGRTLLHQSRPSLADMATGQADLDSSSNEGPSSQVTLGCVKLPIGTGKFL